MKYLVLALLAAVSFNAQADLLRPGQGNFNAVSTLKCYLDNNNDGKVQKSEVLFYADRNTQKIVDVKGNYNFSVTQAVVTKTPGGLIGKIRVSGVARGIAFAGGGSVTLKIETDGLVRRRWNSEVTVTKSQWGREPQIDSNMMDCKL